MTKISSKLNLKGKRFGHLTVIKCDEYKNKKVYWLCKCDCGELCKVPTGNLRSGNTTSCGCVHKERISKLFTTHGKSEIKLYNNVWLKIRARCYSTSCKEYAYYGQRGIKMCSEWKDDFQAFYNWAISNGYKEGLTIDRINNNGNYEPSNCRWVTMKQQARNRRSNINYTINGERRCLKEWCEIYDIGYKTAYSRLHYGWTIEQALELKERK